MDDLKMANLSENRYFGES